MMYPRPLNQGDKIAIVSPAGAVEMSQLTNTLNKIKAKGYEPVLGEHLLKVFDHAYPYAGTEEQRLQDLQWAFDAPEISAIWASRGGYGCVHLLPHLNLDLFTKHPKWYIGYSDNTIIQHLLWMNGIVSIHGQTIKTAPFGVSEESYQTVFDILEGNNFPQYTVDPHPFNRYGTTEGILIGGNLSLIYSVMGTSYAFDFKDKILFIEEIGEAFYALDRMLMNFELAGVFREIKGLIVGGMTNMGTEKDNKNYEESFDRQAYEIIQQRIKNYTFPTLFSFPNGHVYHNKALVVGSKIQLKVDGASGVFTLS